MFAPFLLAAAIAALASTWLALAGTRDPARRALAAALFFSALELLAVVVASADGSAQPGIGDQVRHAAFALAAGAWVVFAATYARDEPFLAGHRRWFLLAVAMAPILCLLVARGDIMVHATSDEALGLAPGGAWMHGAGLLAAIAALLQLERTFAASVGTVRWRIKFMAFGTGTILASRLFSGSQLLITRRSDPALDGFTAAALLAGTVLVLLGLRRGAGITLAVYPSQEVLRRSVTVLLAGVYLLFLGAAASTSHRLAGPAAFAPVAFILLAGLVALAVATYSERARWRLKRFVSRHFQRPLHDARAVWLRLTAATSRCTDPAALGRALADLNAKEFHALSVSVWLLDPRRAQLELVASTASGVERATPESSPGLPAAEIAEHFRSAPAAAELESAAGDWAERLRAANPPMFSRRPHRVAVPLTDHGEFLGVVVLGDRVDGSPFLPGDLEILECVMTQGAASLQGIRLSQSLAETRQLEAFQGMAAFFIHDLKNASFLLSLMLQNFATHFDNPAFRADALRSVSQASGHLNDLIRRLCGLREGLRIEPAEADLNEVVSLALREVPRPDTVTILTQLGAPPRIRADRGQLRKVVTNLLLNATEAVAGDGRIRIATGAEDGWAVLTVGDNGCGMSERFLHDSLFRPFRTTKPAGLGIGMFQSRSIVEAHGGRITVNSQPGEGTVFRIYLKADPASSN